MNNSLALPAAPATGSFFSSRLLLPVFLLLSCLPLVLRADIVHLKNGNALRGRIIHESPDGVSIEVPYGDIFIERDEIAAVEREEAGTYYRDEALRMLSGGDYLDAVRYLRKSLERNPSDTETRKRLMAAHEAEFKKYLRAAMFDEARNILSEMLRDGMADTDVKQLQKNVLDAEDAIDARINQLVKSMDSGHVAEAVMQMEEMLGAGPQLRGRIALPLARGYTMLGNEHYNNRRWEQAAEVWGRAMALDSQRVAVLADLYINAKLKPVAEMINEGRLDDAYSTVKDCLSINPLNPEARLAAGVVCENLHLYAEASIHYAVGLGVEPPDDPGRNAAGKLREQLMKKLDIPLHADTGDRWSRTAQASVPGDWMTLKTPHFSIFNHNTELAALVAQAAEYHYERISQALKVMGDFNPGTRIPIYIFRNADEYRREGDVAAWSGGVARIRGSLGRFDSSILTYQKSSKFLRSTLGHELLHVFMFHLTGYSDLVPMALHEGMAVRFEPDYQHNYYRSLLSRKLDGQGLFTSEQLYGFTKYPPDEELFYAEAYWMLAFLEQLRGFDELQRFILTTADKGIEKALLIHFGIRSFKELDYRWLVWMRTN